MRAIIYFLPFLFLAQKSNAQSVTLVKDIYSFYQTFLPDASLIKNNVAYFHAGTLATGEELWRSDGTPAGTYMLKDLAPNPSSTLELHFSELGDLIIFSCINGADGHLEVWKSDGTQNGTILVRSFPEVLQVYNAWDDRKLVQAGNWVYFVANDGVHGPELWKTDGTTSNTTMVADVSPDDLPKHTPQRLCAYNNRIFYARYTAATGFECWSSDGTESGTALIKDIAPGAASGIAWGQGNHNSAKTDLVATPLGVFFVADDGIHGQELWKTDGTENGTYMVADLYQGDIDEGANIDPKHPNYAFLDGQFYFRGYSDIEGLGLWKTDGTAVGTTLVSKIPGLSGILPRIVSVLGDKIIFEAVSIGLGEKLWVSDGTISGTQMLQDASVGIGTVASTQMINFAGKMWFTGFDNLGQELWQTDGSPGGTLRFEDLNPGALSSFAQYIGVVNNYLLFFAIPEGTYKFKLLRVEAPAVSTNTPVVSEQVYFHINPNPANEFVRLESPDVHNATVKVYRADGVLQTEQHLAIPGKLDVHNFPSGTYWIQLIADGKVIGKAERLIVHHK